jgi:hypothetical protein
MASKCPSTPKKIYKPSGDHAKNCRLCGNVGDAKFSKNLFNRENYYYYYLKIF